ncbi:MAG TPA: hypothetical protein IAB56_02165, partial [Candidatus Scybalousia intestinigallinarum]|nr:hypothetical protein [Candidatus Scybalousia intestinigallinarum]
DATASQILSGKTAWVKGSKVTGTMPNRGAVTQTLNAGGSYTIPEGYHNGSGKVTAASLSSQTQANATAAQILSGRTAWVNGNKVTGTMPSRADSSNVKGDTAWHYNNRIYFATDYGYYPAANYGNFTSVSEKYISYSSLASVIGVSANKILEGNTILGITGTVENPSSAYNRGYSDGYNVGINANTGKYTLIDLGTGSSFDIKNVYGNYSSLTNDNFIVKVENITVNGSGTDNDNDNSSYNGSFSVTPTLSYNASTGILTLGNLSGRRSYKTWGNTGTIITATATVRVYLKY